MDWTVIITSTIGMISAVAVAYIGRSVKKNNNASNDAVQEKFNNIEEKLASITQSIERQSAQLEAFEARLMEQESANLAHQVKLGRIGSELADNNLRTLRLDLLHAIETDPDNQIIIMEMAKKYFVEMKGNCYMSKVFQEWAEDHHVNITGLFNKD